MSQCKRPPKGTPKTVSKALHRTKMMGKHFRNRDPYRKAGFVNPEDHKGVM